DPPIKITHAGMLDAEDSGRVDRIELVRICARQLRREKQTEGRDDCDHNLTNVHRVLLSREQGCCCQEKSRTMVWELSLSACGLAGDELFLHPRSRKRKNWRPDRSRVIPPARGA